MFLVAVTQLACDTLAKKTVYSKEPYKRAVSAFLRAKAKRDKIVNPDTSNDNNNNAKQSSGKSAQAEAKAAKKLQRAEDDMKEAAASVATRHTSPGFFSSIAFIILYRILSIEYAGKVVAVLPFQPWGLLKRMTMKGLHFSSDQDAMEKVLSGSAKVSHPSQACSFIFIYILCTVSVKFFMNKFVGVQPPKGADKGVSTLLDAPKSQRALQSLGVDTDELNEVRKAF